MRDILRHRGLRFVFAANVISMLGSGMNSAAVTWYILQATHSEVSLGWLMVLQTLPAMLLLPFTGVLIDRGDRRRLVMVLDAVRGIIILTVAILAFLHRVHIWQLYLMNILVALGFWIFWPTITALIQELTPESEFVHSNSFLMAGIQGGWLMAGALVGFVYNHIGLGGVLLIDFSTYLVSFSCYLFVRKGRHVVMPAVDKAAEAVENAATGFTRYVHEMREGFAFLRGDRSLLLLGVAWAFFVGAMLTGGIVSAPLSERILHAGAVGYGWLNAGWAVGASLSAFYAPRLIGRSDGASRSGDFVRRTDGGILLVSVLAAAGAGGVALCRRRISAWRKRHCPIDESNGIGSQALHGTRAELHLLRRYRPAVGVRTACRSRCAPCWTELRVRHHRGHVSAGLPEFVRFRRNQEDRCGRPRA